jgi:glycosyltransferase domain-containing protein
MTSNSSQLVVLIPTHNRPHFCHRSLLFHAEHKLGFEFIFVDSSTDENHAKLAAAIQASDMRSSARVQRYDPALGFWGKLHAAVAERDEPFIALLGDDDFLFPGAVKKCLDVFGSDDSLSVVGGRELRVARPSAMLRTNARFSVIVSPQPNIESTSAAHRLYAHLACYWPSIYSVHRRAALLDAFDVARRCPDQLVGAELISSCISLLNGGYRAIPETLLIREVYHDQSTAYSPWHKMVDEPGFPAMLAFAETAFAERLGPQADLALIREGWSRYLASTGVTRPAREMAPPGKEVAHLNAPLPPTPVMEPLAVLTPQQAQARLGEERPAALHAIEAISENMAAADADRPPLPALSYLGTGQRRLLETFLLCKGGELAARLMPLRGRHGIVTASVAERALDENRYRSPELVVAIAAINLCGVGSGGPADRILNAVAGLSAPAGWLAAESLRLPVPELVGADARADALADSLTRLEPPEVIGTGEGALALGDMSNTRAVSGLVGTVASLAHLHAGEISPDGLAKVDQLTRLYLRHGLTPLDETVLHQLMCLAGAVGDRELFGTLETDILSEHGGADEGSIASFLALADRLQREPARLCQGDGVSAELGALYRFARSHADTAPMLDIRCDEAVGAAATELVKHAEAQDALRAAIAKLDNYRGEADWRLSGLLNKLGQSLTVTGSWAAARACHRRALDIHLQAFGEDNGMTPYYRGFVS